MKVSVIIYIWLGMLFMNKFTFMQRDEDGTVIEFYKRAHTHKDGSWVDDKAKNFYVSLNCILNF